MKKETGGICFKPRLDLNPLTDTFTRCTKVFFVNLVLTTAEWHCIHIYLLNVFTDTSKQHTRLGKKNTITAQELNCQLQCSGWIIGWIIGYDGFIVSRGTTTT